MKKLKTLFLAWQDPITRSWFPIGRLTFDGVKYQFVYVKGAQEAQEKYGFEGLLSFPRLEQTYTSTELFAVFSNRLMPRSRPDYSRFIQWLNIPQNEEDPIAMLSRSGGHRETDTLTVFPCPEPDEKGQYHLHFFSQGLRYLLSNIFELLLSDPSSVDVCVELVNQPPTPLQFRLLCSMIIKPSNCDFRPFTKKEYQPIPNELVSEANITKGLLGIVWVKLRNCEAFRLFANKVVPKANNLVLRHPLICQ